MNIAFYPYWAAKTLLSFINVIYMLIAVLFIYSESDSLLYATLFVLIHLLTRRAAGLTFPSLEKRCNISKLMICIPIAKTLLMTGMAIILPHFTLYKLLLLIGVTLFSLVNRWESLLMERLTSQLIEHEDWAKADKLLSFSSNTAAVIGLLMTGIVVVITGASETFWVATSLSWTVLMLILTVNHLISK